MEELKNLYLQNISNYIDDLVPDDPQSEEQVYDLAAAKTNLQLADDELEDLKQKYNKYREIESKLGFKLTDIEPKESVSIDCSAYNEDGVWKHYIFICGDDYYGHYPEDEYKEKVLKDIICGSLYALNKLKKYRKELSK